MNQGQLLSPWPLDNKGHGSEFLQAGCPFSHPTNSVNALMAQYIFIMKSYTKYTKELYNT